MKWIDVRDSLPEPNAVVLIYCGFGTEKDPYIRTRRFRKKTFWREKSPITHWMPLPLPPEEHESSEEA